jgi:hypothetical protein
MALDEDAFETVAITWSQPEAAVILSMFGFYEIPAISVGQQTVRALSYLAVACQGIQIRVHHDWLDEALDLLGNVAEQPPAIRPYAFGQPWIYRTIVLAAAAMFGLVMWLNLSIDPDAIPDDRTLALLACLALPMSLLLTGPAPTRTSSTFLLWKRSRPR